MAPVPVRRFAVGDLLHELTGTFCDCCNPTKVVRVSDDREFIWLSSNAMFEDVFQCKLHVFMKYGRPIEAAFFADDDAANHLTDSFSFYHHEDGLYLEYSANRTIHPVNTFLVFFFSVKLVVIARRVKERMYAPGGIGFIATQESFYRAAKSQRIE